MSPESLVQHPFGIVFPKYIQKQIQMQPDSSVLVMLQHPFGIELSFWNCISRRIYRNKYKCSQREFCACNVAKYSEAYLCMVLISDAAQMSVCALKVQILLFCLLASWCCCSQIPDMLTHAHLQTFTCFSVRFNLDSRAIFLCKWSYCTETDV